MTPSEAPFPTLYMRHRAGVYATALRVLGRPADAEDITQEVFVRYWRSPERFNPKRGELGPYLRLMARSRALDLLRHEQADGRAQDRLRAVAPREEVPREDRPDEAAVNAEQRAMMRASLRRLPPEQREALVLAYWGGLTAREVAAQAGVPFGTARSRMRLGIEKLRTDAALPDAG